MESRKNMAAPAPVAEYMGITTGALAQMRYRGAGPQFVKLGNRTVRYRWEDVDAWIEANILTQSDQDYEPKTAA